MACFVTKLKFYKNVHNMGVCLQNPCPIILTRQNLVLCSNFININFVAIE